MPEFLAWAVIHGVDDVEGDPVVASSVGAAARRAVQRWSQEDLFYWASEDCALTHEVLIEDPMGRRWAVKVTVRPLRLQVSDISVPLPVPSPEERAEARARMMAQLRGKAQSQAEARARAVSLAWAELEAWAKPRAQLAEDIAEGQAEGQAGED